MLIQASVVAMQRGKSRILSTVHDSVIGGRNFDERIAEYFSEEIKRKFKIDLKSHPRSLYRLLIECEKLKKKMSANKAQ